MDGAFRIPVELRIANLTELHRFVHLSVRGVRRDLTNDNPLTLRIERTIATFVGGDRRDVLVEDRSRAVLPFDGSSDGDSSAEHSLFYQYVQSGVDRIDYDFSFLVDRDDIARLEFVFAYIDPAALADRHECRCAMAVGLLLALVGFVWNSPRDVDAKTTFFCVTLGAAGIIGALPVGDEHFEIALDALYVSVYRLFLFLHASFLARNRYEVRIWEFVATAILIGALGIADVTALHVKAAARVDAHIRPTDGGGERNSTEVRHLVLLVAYALVVFVVLACTLFRMRDRYWTRGGLVIVLMVTPMILEFAYELQFPLFGILPYSSLRQISRGACYCFGGILFIVGLTPVKAERTKTVKFDQTM
jgi:hypothetical protein